MIKEAINKIVKQCCLKLSNNTKVTINGKAIIANKEVSIINNEVWIDGAKVEEQEQFDIKNSCTVNISVVGNVNNLSTNGDVSVTGDVTGPIDAGEYVEVTGSVTGNIDARDGIEILGNCIGNVEAGDGIMIEGDSEGNLDAGDSITIKGNHKNGHIDAGDGVYIGSAN